MKGAIPDGSERLCRAIGFGQGVREAFERAATQYPEEANIPRLFVNPAATEADLTLVKP